MSLQVNTSAPIYKICQRVFAALSLTHLLLRRKYLTDIMNKLLAITVLTALLALSAESFRVPRDAEEKGTFANVIDTLKSYYDKSVDTANSYVETVKGYKIEEKAKNAYDETVRAVTTYSGIFGDQLYHMLYSQDTA